MMPLPRPFSVSTVTTLGWTFLTICTTGLNGSIGPCDAVGDETALTGGVVEPARAVVPDPAVDAGAAVGVVDALDMVTQPVTSAAIKASDDRNRTAGCRDMRTMPLHDLVQRSGISWAAAYDLVSVTMFTTRSVGCL